MAFALYPNDIPVSGTQAIFLFKERLKTGGWMVSASSDASTFNSTGDQITISGSGAGGIANTNAWFRLRSPDFLREFLIQRGSSDELWEVWYSSDGVGFVSGSPTATVLPTADDGKQICGINGNVEDWLSPRGRYKTDLLVGDADEGYSFHFQCREQNYARVSAGLFLDVLEVSKSEDSDPAIVGMMLDDDLVGNSFFRANGLCFEGQSTTTTGSLSRCYGWYRKGLSGEEFTVVPMATLGIYSNGDEDGLDQLGNQPEDGSFATFDCAYIRGDSDPGNNTTFFKGISRLFRIVSAVAGHGLLSEDGQNVFMGSVIIPWLSGTRFLK